MLALLAKAPNDYGLERVAIPTPGEGEALVRVSNAAICGSDIKLLGGKLGTPFPLVPGHEFSGIVEEVRGGDSSLVGQAVVLDILQSCGQCIPCHRKTNHFCVSMCEPGINVDGGFAEYVVARPSKLRALRSVSLEFGALIEPLSVVLHAVDRLEPRPSESAVIFGAGGIGLMLLQALRYLGVERIAVVEPVRQRRTLALQLGARLVASPDEDLRTLLGDWGFFAPELVFEAAGDLQAFKSCLDVVAPRGRVGIIGYPPEGKASIDPGVFMRKEIDVRGVLSPTHDWEDAIRWVEEGRIDLGALITHRLPLSSAQEAFSLMRQREDGAVRIVMSCDDAGLP